MKKLLPALFMCPMLVCSITNAQTDTLSTYPVTKGNNGSYGISFELTTNEKIIINFLECQLGTYMKDSIISSYFDLYYREGGVQSIPGTSPTIDAANGWKYLGSSSASAHASYPPPIVLIPKDFRISLVPGTYGFFINADNVRFQNWTASSVDVFTDSVVTLETGQNKGYSGLLPTPSYYPVQFVGSVIYSILPNVANNAGVSSIDLPPNTCAGNNILAATVENLGNNKIDSVRVYWCINNGAINHVVHNSPIDTMGSTSGFQAAVALGNVTFTPNQPCTVKVWTSIPNGSVDPYSINDTLVHIFAPALDGNYTIDSLGAGLTNFLSFRDAVLALENRGICGPVTFHVKEGIYNESFVLDSTIKGTSLANTITFRADTGNLSPIILQDSTSPNNNFIVKFNGIGHVNFHDIRMKSYGTSYTSILVYEHNAHHINIENCKLIAPLGISLALQQSCIVSNYYAGNSYNTFIDNHIEGGSYGIYFNGESTIDLVPGLQIRGNLLKDQLASGIYAYETDSLFIAGNTIISNVNSSRKSYGMFIEHAYNSPQIINNTIKSPDKWPEVGIHMAFSDGGTTTRGLIGNNMIHVGKAGALVNFYGIDVTNLNNFDIVHNNVAVDGPSRNNRVIIMDNGTNNQVLNNNFLNYGMGYVVELDSADVAYELDYNNLATAGPYLGLLNNASTGPLITTLASWQANAFDQHSISEDSIFTNLDSLRTCHDSIVDRGTFLPGIATMDIDDETRDNPPNIGADEFVSSYEPYSIGDTIEFCEGDSVELGTPVDHVSYLWSTSDTTPTIIVTTAGNYSVTIQGACATAADSVALIDVHPVADYDYVVNFDTREVQFTNLSLYGTSYYWDFGDGNTSASQDPLHTYLDTGTYEVNLTVMNPCDTIVFSKIVTISYTGLDRIGPGQLVKMYPNPAGDHLYLDFGKVSYQLVQLEIIDVKGQLQMKKQVATHAPTTIDVSELNKGAYVLRLTMGSETITTRQLIIQ